MYKNYGSTGEKISTLVFGGMRFAEPANTGAMADVVLAAHARGINYLDTAPGYCNDQSEKIMGHAIRQLQRENKQFYISSKTSQPTADGVRENLNRSLERLGVDCIDFYHCWYILTLDGWKQRISGGAVDELVKAKEEGLIRHLVFSTHLSGEDVKTVIDEGPFEGVTLGYNAVNFPYRQEGVNTAGKAGLGVVVMNPLGGGTIVQNPENFTFIKNYPEQSILEAALSFLWAHEYITAALVGFRNIEDVNTACDAWEKFDPAKNKIDIDYLKKHIESSFDRLCTGCQYCRDCPQDIAVYKYIESYNHLMLKGGESLEDRLKWHYGLSNIDDLDRCTECGNCEDMCTQHLPIIERLNEIKRVYGKSSHES